MRRIKYIVPYDIEENKIENRQYSLAAKYKVEYIIDVLNELGYGVDIISIAHSNNKRGFYPSKKIKINTFNELTLCPTFGAYNKALKLLRFFLSNIWFLIYLLKEVKKNEQLILYHTQSYLDTIIFAQKFKKIKIILELEEFYYKFGLCSKSMEDKEKNIIKRADKYILSNKNQMHEIADIAKRPNCIVHGNYNVYDMEFKSNKSGRIVIIFAGGIDRIRNSAHNALQIVKYLNKNYILKIIGYGSDLDIQLLCQEISIINEELGYEACEFCGTKTGLELQDFYKHADIALNIQNVHDYYMDYAFPSKIIAYLSYGLHVISTSIKTLETSSVAPFILFTKTIDPKDVANTIKKVDANGKNVCAINYIKRLDVNFKNDLSKMLLVK